MVKTEVKPGQVPQNQQQNLNQQQKQNQPGNQNKQMNGNQNKPGANQPIKQQPNNNNNNNPNNQNNQNNNNNNNNNRNQNNRKNFHQNQNRNDKQGGGGGGNNRFQNGENNKDMPNQFNNYPKDKPIGERKFTGRCRLFVGNLPTEITEAEFKELFMKFGEIGECFLNTSRSFGFIKLDTRINAEHAKQDLDGFQFKGRHIRVRFASHGAAVRVKNLSPFVSNEYLEKSFSIFGPVERAVVIVDEKGRPTGEGIVEFERKPASIQCINKCTDGCFILGAYPRPVVVEPLEQKDDEDGLPEKSLIRNAQFAAERDKEAHFPPPNSMELSLAYKWRDFYELEKQIMEDAKKRIEQARELLEYEIEQAMIDYKTMQLKEDLRAKQEELQRIEEMRKSELQRRQDFENRFKAFRK